MDEFVEAAKKISALPGKYGYCLRGGPGGLNGWVMFGATDGRRQHFLQGRRNLDHRRTGLGEGRQMARRPLQEGLAPKDSVNWGFNEIVAGFYSGTCAMLDQDPDALIAVAERMKPEDFGVTTMPKGPDGKGFPTIGYAGWSMFTTSQNKDLSWKLIETLEGPKAISSGTSAPARCRSTRRRKKIPSMPAAVQGLVRGAGRPNVVPTVMPTYLEEFAFFKDSLVIKTSERVWQRRRRESREGVERVLTQRERKFMVRRRETPRGSRSSAVVAGHGKWRAPTSLMVRCSPRKRRA